MPADWFAVPVCEFIIENFQGKKPFSLFQNILDKFNPGARQMITAGKAYLKALHGEYNLMY